MVIQLEERFQNRKSEIEKIVNDIINHHQLQISQFIIENLTIHLTLCVLRVQNGTYIPTSISQISQLQKNKYYQIAKEIIHSLEDKYQIQLHKDQIAYTTMYLDNIHLLDMDIDFEYDVFDENMGDVINETVDEIYKQLNVDLKEYPEFYKGITLHFFPALERLQNDQQLINNPLKDQIKLQNIREYQCALIFNSVVEKYYHLSFNEHELAYIAVHFATVFYTKED